MWQWLGITDDKKNSKEAETTADGNNTEKNDENPDKESDVSQKTESIADKSKEVAGNIGNYLYTFANAATKTASKLKTTVGDKLDETIVGDFNRENEKFIQEKEARRVGDAVPPWVGYHEEETMKQQILALPDDERNFLRDPPTGVDFSFNIEQMMPVAMAALKEDAALKDMRFKLVPKRIKEERFWRNYFYRVTLIKQSTQLSTMADIEISKKSPRNSSSESLNTKDIENTETNDEPHSFQDVSEIADSPSNHEFVSDAFTDNADGLSEEERNQMLGTTNQTNDKEEEEEVNIDDLEKELEEELESFELVDDDKQTDTVDGDDSNWEKEIEDMLEFDEEEKK